MALSPMKTRHGIKCLRVERQFNLYVNGVFYGPVWLTHFDTLDLEPIGRAVSGLKRWRSKSRPMAVYIEVLT